jgi:hypothetical protein
VIIKQTCRILYNLSSKLYVKFSRVDKLEILLNAKIPGKNTVTPEFFVFGVGVFAPLF